MRIARVGLPGAAVSGGATAHDAGIWVRAEGPAWVPIENPWLAFAAGREPEDLPGAGQVTGQVTFLPPSDPTLVVGIAQNGPDHHSPVQAWLKSPRGVIGAGQEVLFRRDAGQTFIEGEIAVVIGKDTEGLNAENAHEYVLGITAVNDISSPERASGDPRNFEGKGGAGYTPLGPWIETGSGLENIPMTVSINGETLVETSSEDLPSSIRECLAYVAHWVPLGPGDVVMTGAPHSNFAAQPGDTVSITVGKMTLETQTR